MTHWHDHAVNDHDHWGDDGIQTAVWGGAYHWHETPEPPKPTPRQRWKWFFCGVGYRLPFCCVLRFTFCRHMEQGCVRGAVEDDRHGRFVPCLVFHRPNVTAAEIRVEAGLD